MMISVRYSSRRQRRLSMPDRLRRRLALLMCCAARRARDAARCPSSSASVRVGWLVVCRTLTAHPPARQPPAARTARLPHTHTLHTQTDAHMSWEDWRRQSCVRACVAVLLARKTSDVSRTPRLCNTSTTHPPSRLSSTTTRLCIRVPRPTSHSTRVLTTLTASPSQLRVVPPSTRHSLGHPIVVRTARAHQEQP